MHYYDASAYRAKIDPPIDYSKVPRLDDERLSSKPCTFAVPEFDLSVLRDLPSGSFSIKMSFTLATPFSSKDDRGPEKKHSPIVKDWAYQVPLVRPTTWKGRLRFAAGQSVTPVAVITHLFGSEKSSEKKEEGRLHFFPTFFQTAPSVNRTVEEIFNPHYRISRRGKGPVNITCIPANTPGVLWLLYVDPTDVLEYNAIILAPMIVSWAKELIEFHGIGAKTLKGYGLGRVDSAVCFTRNSRVDIIRPSQGGVR